MKLPTDICTDKQKDHICTDRYINNVTYRCIAQQSDHCHTEKYKHERQTDVYTLKETDHIRIERHVGKTIRQHKRTERHLMKVQADALISNQTDFIR